MRLHDSMRLHDWSSTQCAALPALPALFGVRTVRRRFTSLFENMQKRAAASRRSGFSSGSTSIRARSSVSTLSLPYKTLLDSIIRMLSAACSVVDDGDEHNESGMADEAQQTAQAMIKFKKAKNVHQTRYDILEAVLEAADQFLHSLTMLNEEEAAEHEVQELVQALLVSTLTILNNTLEEIREASGEKTKRSDDAQIEAAAVLQLLEVLILAAINGKTTKKAFAEHFAPVTKIAMDVAQQQQYALSLRQEAVEFLEMLLLTHASLLDDQQLVMIMVAGCYTLCAMPDDANRIDEQDDDEETPNEDMGTTLFSALAASVPDKMAFATLIVKISTDVSDGVDANKRRSALSALAVLPEPIPSIVDDKVRLDDIIGLIKRGTTDKDARVRAAAFVAYGEFFEHVYDSIAHIHTETFDLIMSTLSNSDENIKVKIESTLPLQQLALHLPDSAFAGEQPLAFVIAGFAETIAKNKDALNGSFAMLLHSYLSVLRALASDSRIVLQAPRVLSLCLSICNENEQIFFPARRAAVAIIGELSQTAKTVIVEHFSRTMSILLAGYEINNEELRSSTHATFAQFAVAFDTELEPFLEQLSTAVAAPLSLLYGASFSEDIDGFGGETGTGDEDDEESEDGDDEGDDSENEDDAMEPDDEDIKEVRENALMLFAYLLDRYASKFRPFCGPAAKMLFNYGTHYNDELHVPVAKTLALFTRLYCKLPAGAPIPPIIAGTVKLLLSQIINSNDLLSTECSFHALNKVVSHFGVDSINSQQIEKLLKHVSLLLRGKSMCQLKPGQTYEGDDDDFDGDENQDEDSEALDTLFDMTAYVNHSKPLFTKAGKLSFVRPGSAPVPQSKCGVSCNHNHHDDNDEEETQQKKAMFRAVSSLLSTIAGQQQSKFAPHVKILWPLIELHLDDSNLKSQLLIPAGDFAACSGTAFDVGASKAFNILVQEQESATDARAAAYAIGKLFQYASKNIAEPFVQQGIETLKQYITRFSVALDDESLAARDSASSALGRLFLAWSDKVNVPDVVSSFSSGLPLRYELDESPTIISAAAAILTPSNLPSITMTSVCDLLRGVSAAALHVHEQFSNDDADGMNLLSIAKTTLQTLCSLDNGHAFQSLSEADRLLVESVNAY